WRDKRCVHKQLKTACPICLEAENQRMIKWEEERRSEKLERDKQTLYRQECERYRQFSMRKASYVRELSPNGFEDAIAELFRALGYKVQQTPYVNDGGKEAIAFKNGKKYAIEC